MALDGESIEYNKENDEREFESSFNGSIEALTNSEFEYEGEILTLKVDENSLFLERLSASLYQPHSKLRMAPSNMMMSN